MPEQREFQMLDVRPIGTEEDQRWNQLMKEHHYLGFRQLVGESIKYVAELNGEWVALLGWGTAAFKCGARDEWIGWSKEQQWRRLIYIANNSRFLIFSGNRIPNLASKVLSMNLRRLSCDWMAIHGHPVVLAETFVEHSRFAGTCYQASNWKRLGQTRGFGRNGGKYYHHGVSKAVYVYPLHRRARQLLSACFLASELTGGQRRMIDLNDVNCGEDGGLLWHLQQLTDHRMRRGIRHDAASILSVAVCAVLSGARSFAAMGEWAADLSQDMLRRLGCRFHPEKCVYIPPSEPTIRRHLRNMDAEELDSSVSAWLSKQVNSDVIAIDGKTLKGAKDAGGKQVHLMSCILHKEGIVVSQVEVDKKTNEITCFRPLLDKLDIKGKVVTADAMHTQVDHAKYVKEEREADYFFTVKGNQRTLLEAIELLPECDFSPCVCRGRKGAWADRET